MKIGYFVIHGSCSEKKRVPLRTKAAWRDAVSRYEVLAQLANYRDLSLPLPPSIFLPLPLSALSLFLSSFFFNKHNATGFSVRIYDSSVRFC